MDDEVWTFEYGQVYMSGRIDWTRSYFVGPVDKIADQARICMLANARENKMVAVRLFKIKP